MRIEKSKVVLDSQYRNVLVREFSKNYPSLDKLASPADIVCPDVLMKGSAFYG